MVQLDDGTLHSIKKSMAIFFILSNFFIQVKIFTFKWHHVENEYDRVTENTGKNMYLIKDSFF